MNTMIKKIALFLFAGMIFCNAYADDTQELMNVYNSFLPDFQKLTPEASALGQYGQYQSPGYTGVPNISVPLFSLSSGDFSMPVELHYDASGIKVDQQATYVGLGWNLIMGGSISQIICGKNDFYENIFTTFSISNLDLMQDILPSLLGSLPYYCLTFFPTVRYPATGVVGSTFPLVEDRKKCDILQEVAKGGWVPDIFQASFCGHSVSFVIDKNSRKARIIGNDATTYKIELMEYTGPYPFSIEITDDHGFKYYFTAAPLTSMEDNAAYNLSIIKNPGGRILVEFEYEDASYTLLRSYYETVGKNDEEVGMPIASQAIYNMFVRQNYPSSLVYGIKEHYPKTIITDKETVSLMYGTREDIKNAKKIDSIKVVSNNDRTKNLHTVIFKYGYFSESAFESSLCSRYRYSDWYGYKRLKLTDVTVDGRKYAFGYNDNLDLPSRLTKRQDYWGYYNGQNNSNGLCASPKYKFNYNGQLEGAEVVGSANRYASENFCKVGILNKITYPTGGYTKFDYEINHFNDDEGLYYYPSANSNLEYVRKESCGSGYNGHGYSTTPDETEFDVSQPVKVEITTSSPYLPTNSQYYKLYFSIIGKDSSGKTVFSKNYTKYNDRQDYEESYILPKGHYVLSSQVVNVTSGLIIGGGIQVKFPPEYRVDTSIADASGKSIGAGLRVKTIENYDSDNTLLGYTRYKYDDGKLLIPTVKPEYIYMMYLFTEKTPNYPIYTMPQSFFCAFYFINSSPTNLAVCSLGSPHVGYTKVTKENYDKKRQLMSYEIENYNNAGYTNASDNVFNVNRDGLNGKLAESTTYSKDHSLMHKVSYSYKIFGDNPAISDMVFFPWSRCTDMDPGGSALEACFKYSIYSKSPVSALPLSITETSYTGGSALRSMVTTYEYKGSNYQPVSVTKTVDYGSNAKEISQIKYWYPEDTEVSSSNTSYLTSVHSISEHVKAEEYKNGKIVSGYRNVYGVLSNGLPVISKNYSIDSSKKELLELDVTDFDSYGNIREFKMKNQTPVTVIWSYNHQVPVMEIVGMTYSEVKNKYSNIASLENATIATTIINMTEALHAVFRENDVMATAYEYSPWYTVSCIISPNGNKTRYNYDSYGRLEKVSDNANKTLQKYSYKYRTN